MFRMNGPWFRTSQAKKHSTTDQKRDCLLRQEGRELEPIKPTEKERIPNPKNDATRCLKGEASALLTLGGTVCNESPWTKPPDLTEDDIKAQVNLVAPLPQYFHLFDWSGNLGVWTSDSVSLLSAEFGMLMQALVICSRNKVMSYLCISFPEPNIMPCL